MHLNYEVIWSEEDGEYVARVTNHEPYKGLSYLDISPDVALNGLIYDVIFEAMKLEDAEAKREAEAGAQTRSLPDETLPP